MIFLVTVGLLGCGQRATENSSNQENFPSESIQEEQNLDLDSFINLKECIVENDFVIEKNLDVRELNANGQYDLNQDGKPDSIDIRLKGEGDSLLQINNCEMPIRCENPMNVYLVDLIAEDVFVELAIYDDGPSGDPVTTFYRYDGKEIYELGSFYTDIDVGDSIYLYYGNVLTDKKGIFIPPDSIVKFVRPNIIKGYYSINHHKLSYHPVDYTKSLVDEYVIASDFEAFFKKQDIKSDLNIQDIEFTWDTGEAAEFREGEKIKLLKMDDFWYGIERQDGTRGILYFWMGD